MIRSRENRPELPETSATPPVRLPSAVESSAEPLREEIRAEEPREVAPSAPAETPPTEPPLPDRSRERPAPPPRPKPPRGMRWRTLVFGLVAAALFFAVGTLWGATLMSGTRRLWQQVTGADEEVTDSDLAGDLPNQFWTCGMHPWIILPEPGLCPICHMDLTPLDPGKLSGEIAIDPVIVQNIGVRIAPVTTGPLRKEIRTLGTVTYDEAAVRDVNIKFAGWIEDLYVDETGAAVQEGAPLFSLYSPELYQAQEEYLISLKGNRSLTRSLTEAARMKLEYLDVTPEQIEALERRGTAEKTLTVNSPHSGVVIEKNAHEGMKIEPGTLVYRIADLSTVWVIATVYEYQLPYLKVGQTAAMTLPYLAGETFEGKVAYIYPYLQEASREVKVRLEFPNPDGRLKPGMFANVELESTLDREAVLAPREAVIMTGTREVAFVSQGEGRFEPREVEVGVETESGLVEILDGLEPGEKVVTSGQFLLDSESKMRSALAKMIKGEPAAEQSAEAEVAEATVLAPLPPAAAERLNEALTAYAAVGDRLTANTTDGIAARVNELTAAMDTLAEVPLPGRPEFWNKSREAAAVRGKAAELAEAKTLDDARLIYASLSGALTGLLEETGVPLSFDERVEALSCPMFPPKEGGAVWLQSAGPARNPYMGEGPMLRCVGDRTLLPVAGGGDAAESGAVDLDAAALEQVDELAASYLALHEALYTGKAAGTEETLRMIRQAALELAESPHEGLRSAAADIAAEAERKPDDLPGLRAAFKSLSAAVIDLVRIVPPGETVTPALREVYCPMAKASWLQAGTKVRNPYYGQGHDMADCGETKGAIEPRPLSDETPDQH